MEDHNIAPVYDENSRVLVLGSFPSVRSREQKFFYGHPHNRFWKVLALVFEEEVPENIDEKKNLLLRHNIALWNVIASCDIDGSSDSSIKNVAFNDLSQILSKADVRAVVLNGKTAEKYYKRYSGRDLSVNVIALPSTSPANAAWSLDRLVSEWRILKKYCD